MRLLFAGMAAVVVVQGVQGVQSVRVQTPQFQPLVAPFEVLDTAGRAYEYAFLGGFDAPRPQLVDIDGDRDLDLFIQEYNNELAFFENVEEAGRRRFAWRTDRFQDLAIGEWYRFADLDGDGDQDLLSELPYSYIRFWRNEGTARAPRFTAAPDSLRDEQGRAIFADRQNIAQLGDVDCDGRADLLIGRVQGTVTRYVLADAAPGGTPRFTFVTDRFEDIEIIGTNSQPGMGQPSMKHGANTMALADLDSDGDADLLWGDFFEPGLLFIENIGSCANMNLRSAPQPWPQNAPLRTSGYNAPAVGDLDGDGALDVLVGVLGGAYNPLVSSVENLYQLRRGPGGWAVATRRYLGQFDVGSEAIPALADIDGDRDLDILVSNRVDPGDGSTGRLRLLRNLGTVTRPRFREEGLPDVRGGFQLAPAIADLDGDGDVDLLTGGYGPGISLWRNEGTAAAPRFVLSDTSLARIPRGSNTVPALGDMDGDGDLDLLVGEASGAINHFRNEGTATQPRFVLVTETWQSFEGERRTTPSFADIDRDGDLDVLVGTSNGRVYLFPNTGSRAAPAYPMGAQIGGGLRLRPLTAPAAADLDGDGDMDLITGTSSGGLLYFRNGS